MGIVEMGSKLYRKSSPPPIYYQIGESLKDEKIGKKNKVMFKLNKNIITLAYVLLLCAIANIIALIQYINITDAFKASFTCSAIFIAIFVIVMGCCHINSNLSK